MHQTFIALMVGAAVVGLVGFGWGHLSTAAQETSANDRAAHPIVGTWVVDTVVATESDPPEIAVFTVDGVLVGLGANRAVGGRWDVVDPRTVMLTLVTVFDGPGGAGYVVVRGPHTVDESGETWDCACTFTVVAADGTVIDSGEAPASGRRLPVQGPDAMGTPLAEVPTWTPASPAAATPTP
jgi:hypothetical protein